MRLIKLAIVIILSLFVLTACGRGGDAQIMRNPQDLISGTTQEVSGEETDNQDMTGDDLHTPTVTQSSGTLRILAPTHFRPMLNAASLNINLTQGVELDVTFFDPEARADYWANRLPQAIANDEFDIFFTDLRFPLFEMARDGLLADIFPMINVHDFYAEALQTLTIDNSLYFFPLNFGFQYVSINSRWIPQPFIDRFNSYETITVNQMMEIYLDIRRNHTILLDIETEGAHVLHLEYTLLPTPGPVSLNLANCRDLLFPEYMVWNAIMDYVDLNNMTSNLLDDGFINFLTNMLTIFPWEEEDSLPAYRIRYSITPLYYIQAITQLRRYVPIWIHNNLWWEELHYAFVVHNQFLNPLSALTPLRTDLGAEWPLTHFHRYIPLVDEMGRLRTNISTAFPWNTISIVNNSNAYVAWEFVSRYLMSASICPQINEIPVNIPATPTMSGRLNSGLHTVNSPVERTAAAAHLPYIFTLTKDHSGAWCEYRQLMIPGVALEGIQEAPPEVLEQTIARVVAQIEEMNEMLMAPVALIPFELFEPALQNMLRRFASPEATAQIIHDNVVRWMGN